MNPKLIFDLATGLGPSALLGGLLGYVVGGYLFDSDAQAYGLGIVAAVVFAVYGLIYDEEKEKQRQREVDAHFAERRAALSSRQPDPIERKVP